jgi:hypothetical protein
VTLEQLIPGIVGAFLGAFGWLVVGLFIQRQQFARQAKNAARAVYFELDANATNVQFAIDHSAFGSLSRSSYERVLPELATWLRPDELLPIVRAYMTHAGYDQARSDRSIPADLRRTALERMLREHTAARDVLRVRVFTPREQRLLSDSRDG